MKLKTWMALPTAALLLGVCAGTPSSVAQDAAALKVRHQSLHGQLANNQFQRPIVLESTEVSGALKGQIYAEVEQPFERVGPAIQRLDQWCDMLMLHLNVKGCRASSHGDGARLTLNVGRKYDQPLKDAYPIEFVYRVAVTRPDYLKVTLDAKEGPLGTRHYRIALEVMALDAGRSFLHLSYGFDYGVMSHLAMRGYLATIGRGKVGFTVVGNATDGQPIHIGSVRGAVERNTMRYYLAVEAYLGALTAPAGERMEKRLSHWFDGSERYPVQLHELERGEYLDMKRREIARLHQGVPAAAGSWTGKVLEEAHR